MNYIHHFSIPGETKESLLLAVQLAFEMDANHMVKTDRKPLPKAVCFELSVGGIAFYSRPVEGCWPFLSPMDAREVGEAAWKWLQDAEYPPPPDHDGSNHRGWLLSNTHENGWKADHGFIVRIQPHWVMYLK